MYGAGAALPQCCGCISGFQDDLVACVMRARKRKVSVGGSPVAQLLLGLGLGKDCKWRARPVAPLTRDGPHYMPCFPQCCAFNKKGGRLLQ